MGPYQSKPRCLPLLSPSLHLARFTSAAQIPKECRLRSAGALPPPAWFRRSAHMPPSAARPGVIADGPCKGDGWPERSRRLLRVRTTPLSAPVGEEDTAAARSWASSATRWWEGPRKAARRGGPGCRPRPESVTARRLPTAAVVVRGGGAQGPRGQAEAAGPSAVAESWRRRTSWRETGARRRAERERATRARGRHSLQGSLPRGSHAAAPGESSSLRPADELAARRRRYSTTRRSTASRCLCCSGSEACGRKRRKGKRRRRWERETQRERQSSTPAKEQHAKESGEIREPSFFIVWPMSRSIWNSRDPSRSLF
ncbi:unnamed protein product [Urochloa humidicola]